MKVRVDETRCQGHSRCLDISEELFDVDDAGYAFARGDGEVPADLVDAARSAEANCPERAILLEGATAESSTR